MQPLLRSCSVTTGSRENSRKHKLILTSLTIESVTLHVSVPSTMLNYQPLLTSSLCFHSPPLLRHGNRRTAQSTSTTLRECARKSCANQKFGLRFWYPCSRLRLQLSSILVRLFFVILLKQVVHDDWASWKIYRNS